MLVLGMMSGTSADGIDVALAQIHGAPPKLKTQLLKHASRRMPDALRKEVLRIAEGAPATAGEISQLNFRLGIAFADAAISACREFRVALSRVELIGSHGQTIFHQGSPVSFLGRSTSSTMQIGEPSVIAARNRRPHRRRFSRSRHGRRRPGRPASSLRRLSSLRRRKNRPRLPQSWRHRQPHRSSRRRQAQPDRCLRQRPR